MLWQLDLAGGHSERSERTEKHKQQYPFYPDPDNYMNLTEKYFYRSEDLRHLRLEQFHRYFSVGAQDQDYDDTPDIAGVQYQSPDACCHRHFDGRAQAAQAGEVHAALATSEITTPMGKTLHRQQIRPIDNPLRGLVDQPLRVTVADGGKGNMYKKNT